MAIFNEYYFLKYANLLKKNKYIILKNHLLLKI